MTTILEVFLAAAADAARPGRALPPAVPRLPEAAGFAAALGAAAGAAAGLGEMPIFSSRPARRCISDISSSGGGGGGAGLGGSAARRTGAASSSSSLSTLAAAAGLAAGLRAAAAPATGRLMPAAVAPVCWLTCMEVAPEGAGAAAARAAGTAR